MFYFNIHQVDHQLPKNHRNIMNFALGGIFFWSKKESKASDKQAKDCCIGKHHRCSLSLQEM